MRKYLYGALALTAVAMAATAVPAFTADNGTVAVSVTAAAPAAPCLTFDPGSVDFGTKPFSISGNPAQGTATLNLTNCGTANENMTIAGTDAFVPGSAWTLEIRDTPYASTCAAGLDKYFLDVTGLEQPDQGPGVYGIQNAVSRTAAMLHASSGTTHVFAPSSQTPLRLILEMPCQGSDGAGGTASLALRFVAFTT
jgi:hypothetical protein